MANIFDYLDWRGDLTFAERPFNEVDNLILAEICYLDFSGFVPQGFAARLQQALPAIDLTAQAALLTAFANDVDPDMVFAQQVYGYGRAGDALLALTTSGNSKNVVNAVHAARARGMRTLGITGEGESALSALCDVCLRLPARETARVQEYTLPVYHALCALIEDEFFAE